MGRWRGRLGVENDEREHSALHLPADTGNVHLDRQISTVTTLLRIADDKADFDRLFGKAFPSPQGKPPLIIEVDEGNSNDVAK